MRRRSLALVVLCAALAVAPASASEGPDTELLGRSALGRPIEVVRRGDPAARRRVLVIGCIHGDECAGTAIAVRLVRMRAPSGTALWIVPNLNPDGFARRHRQNGRGVDLNRNFGAGWIPIGRPWDPQHSGPRPWSEPETRLIRRLILRVRPTLTVWYHQPQGIVRAWGPSIPAARRYARLAGERFRALRWPHGTGPSWQNHRFPGTPAFVVELPPGRLSPARARRHADAVRRMAF